MIKIKVVRLGKEQEDTEQPERLRRSPRLSDGRELIIGQVYEDVSIPEACHWIGMGYAEEVIEQ